MATRGKILSVFLFSIVFASVGIMAQESKNNEYPIKISIELPDTIYVEPGNVPIILKIENTTSKVLSISNPKYWGYIYTCCLEMKMRGRTGFTDVIRWGIDAYDVIEIKEYETLRIKLGTLDELLRLSYPFVISLGIPIGKYDIYFEYYYESKKKPIFKRNMYKKRYKQLTSAKFVTSDVVTLYVCEKDNFPDLLRHIR